MLQFVICFDINKSFDTSLQLIPTDVVAGWPCCPFSAKHGRDLQRVIR